ncbi:MAG: FAD-dependent oxidoreductase [Candidatus Margulisbacteria bacterium]|nr:FAD-dependent oxidoreductase [Candidatus Margulisiibacteriota bacterium]
MIEESKLQVDISIRQSSDAYDVIVIGAGPAGMSAALCAGRAKLKTLLIDKSLPGGEASTAYIVDNFLGFPDGILGVDLASKMEDHLKRVDVEFVCTSVDSIQDSHAKIKQVHTNLGTVYKAVTIILAMGLEPKPLGTLFERQFMGRGVSYYAQGDASWYRGKNVAVVGGGNCACYAADYLSQYVDHLYLIHRSDGLKAVKTLKDRVLANPKIRPIWNSEVEDAFGVDRLEKIKVLNRSTGQYTWLDIKCLFVYVGRIPPKELLTLSIKVDEKGFILTDEYMRTTVPGIYAAGDIREKQIRQIATAVSDGMIAAVNAGRELE